ncbi:unnamed protein product [Lactuca virosa]|uniref:Hexosyltransferase n=1 Tax=Lactuca virosa TaxID=75947 RepID=A0AAU9PD88_9ASTR|nr:unnamed protein product [Lactuca virosa]
MQSKNRHSLSGLQPRKNERRESAPSSFAVHRFTTSTLAPFTKLQSPSKHTVLVFKAQITALIRFVITSLILGIPSTPKSERRRHLLLLRRHLLLPSTSSPSEASKHMGDSRKALSLRLGILRRALIPSSSFTGSDSQSEKGIKRISASLILGCLHVLGLGYNPSVSHKEIEKATVIHYNGNLKPWLEIGIPKFQGYWNRFLDYDQAYMRDCNSMSS